MEGQLVDYASLASAGHGFLTQFLPTVFNRNGHGCMLQYALLHLFGYKVSLDDLKAFRVRLLPLNAYVFLSRG